MTILCVISQRGVRSSSNVAIANTAGVALTWPWGGVSLKKVTLERPQEVEPGKSRNLQYHHRHHTFSLLLRLQN